VGVGAIRQEASPVGRPFLRFELASWNDSVGGVLGTILNVAGILIGGISGMLRKTPLAASTQGILKLLLGLATVVCGFWLIWRGLEGCTFPRMLLLLVVVVVSMMIGRPLGRLMQLQKASNHLGRYARNRMEAVTPGRPLPFSDAFNACTVVFCAAPLGMVGALVDGLANLWFPLAIKAVMDGLATMGFVSLFGRASIAAAFPVLAFQGTIALCGNLFLGPWLESRDLLGPVIATAGVLMFSVALVILESKRIELADYLPSLMVAPVLMAGIQLLL
jgi:uncharacterized membrane protein YqgA involved in biofilm formation